MSNYDPNAGQRRRRAARNGDTPQQEPSMKAPMPMPGKPAASYVSQQPQPQANWHPPGGQEPSAAPQGWQTNRYPQGYGYPVQGQRPSQGVPAQAQSAPSYRSMQNQPGMQGGSPYQQPTGRGWSQPYPQAQNPQNPWQGGYAPAAWNGTGYSPVGDGQPPRQAPPRRRTGLLKLIAAAGVLTAAIVLVVALFLRENQIKAIQAEVAAYNDRYCQGVYVDGIHLGGMTKAEALEVVQRNAQQKCDEWHVWLQTSDGEIAGEINSEHLGLTVHVEDALDAAWQQGHTGADVYTRKAAMDALLETPYSGSTALPGSSTDAVETILNEIAAGYYVAAVDATCTFDPAKTNPFEITDHSYGRWLDVQSIKEKVYDMVSRMESGTIQIEPTVLYPSITREDWAQRTALIASAYTKISTTSEEGRNKNIERACDLINGTVIQPGETFSFNTVVGARSAANGFYQAIEYAYSKEKVGYGGGVCQVSSTIYWAAVRANMEIVKREQHALKVGYTQFGFDATVNYDGRKIDFVFRNTTGSPVYIITKVVKRPAVDKSHYLVLCELYGVPLETGVTYDIVATTKEIPIPEATVVPDKTAQYVVYTDDTYTVAGKVGYEVDSYRVKYVDGAEVERTFMYHDTYSAVQPITYVGVNERPIETEEQ